MTQFSSSSFSDPSDPSWTRHPAYLRAVQRILRLVKSQQVLPSEYLDRVRIFLN
ncbi:MAG: hypothetical protein FJZ75_10325 [Bacteroidetes bacterium]|nr:hypothetical protein [Bacteroidota bacterium]